MNDVLGFALLGSVQKRGLVEDVMLLQLGGQVGLADHLNDHNDTDHMPDTN